MLLPLWILVAWSSGVHAICDQGRMLNARRGSTGQAECMAICEQGRMLFAAHGSYSLVKLLACLYDRRVG